MLPDSAWHVPAGVQAGQAAEEPGPGHHQSNKINRSSGPCAASWAP